MDIKGSVALVTGANRGLGKCFVVKRKDHVLADDRAEETWRTSREHPAQLAALQQHAWDTRPK